MAPARSTSGTKRTRSSFDPPALNHTPNGQMHPTLSGDGKRLAFTAWARPGGSSRWDLFLYDLDAKKLLDLPGLNTPTFDERHASLQCERCVARVCVQRQGRHRADGYLSLRLSRLACRLRAGTQLAERRHRAKSECGRSVDRVCFGLARRRRRPRRVPSRPRRTQARAVTGAQLGRP